MPEAKRGQSLWKDAWRRLRRNRFAMGGLVVVTLMALTAILADVLIPYEPDYGQPWLLANPPGFEHPAVLAEIRFDKGEAPVVPDRIPPTVAAILGDPGVIEYTLHEIADTEYRIKLRRGRVDRIAKQEGARRVDRIEVSGPREYLQRIGDDGPEGPELRDIALERRQPLPAELETKERILLVKVRRPRTPAPERVRVVIGTLGAVSSIVRDGREIDKLRAEGRYVLEVTKDGEEKRLGHWLGTDLAGRDVLSRVIYGGRISLMVGAVATLVSVIIGVCYGAAAGYLAVYPMTVWGFASAVTAILAAAVCFLVPPGFLASFALAFLVLGGTLAGLHQLGKRISWRLAHRPVTTSGEFMMRIVDIIFALPYLFLVILLMISYGRDLITLFIALGAVQWLTMARIVRGQVLSLKEKEFVEAAHMCGTGHLGILFRHLVPNTLGVVTVYATLTIPAVILQESFLAFIGLTVEYQGRTLDSWGSLVNQGRQALTSTGGNWWVLVFPSVAMAVTLFSLNFLGDGLRDALDPKLKGRT